MKITLEKNVNLVKFGSLTVGETFTHKGANPDSIYLKIRNSYQFDANFTEQLLEGCADSDELDEYAFNCVSLKNGETRYFAPADDVIKIAAEVIVHN